MTAHVKTKGVVFEQTPTEIKENTETFRIRSLLEAGNLATKLAENCPEVMHFGIHELLINAVEHGNLEITSSEKSKLFIENKYHDEIFKRLNDPKYSQRSVQILLKKDSEKISLIITDQGNGFNPEAYLNHSLKNLEGISGRGISLSKEISFDSLQYSEKGNQVIAVTYL